MPNIIRWLGVILAVMLSAFATVLLPFMVVKEGLDILHKNGWVRLTIDIPDMILRIFPGLGIPKRIVDITAPGPWDYLWVVEMSAWSVAPFFVMLLLFNLSVPVQRRVRSTFGVESLPLRTENPLYEYVQSLSKHTRGPVAQVHVLPVRDVQAFAMGGPFGGGLILISHGALERLSADEIRWVLAHEYGHIKYRDARSATFWLLSQRGIHLFDDFRHRLANITLRLVSIIPLLQLFTYPLWLSIRFLSLFGRTGQRIGATFFLLFDCFGGRQAELRADRFAASMEGVAPGVSLFEKLRGDIEPRFGGLFATHPSFQKRIANIEAMNSTEARQEG